MPHKSSTISEISTTPQYQVLVITLNQEAIHLMQWFSADNYTDNFHSALRTQLTASPLQSECNQITEVYFCF